MGVAWVDLKITYHLQAKSIIINIRGRDDSLQQQCYGTSASKESQHSNTSGAFEGHYASITHFIPNCGSIYTFSH